MLEPSKSIFLHKIIEAAFNEMDCITDQENKSIPFKTIIDRKEVVINYKLALTMIDIKIFNAITSNLSTCILITYVRQLQSNLMTFIN